MSGFLINVTVPVFNEEKCLTRSVDQLLAFLEAHSPHPYEIVIANNGSTDRTLEIARQLESRHTQVRVNDSAKLGRGGAVKRAWRESHADILTYMDVDLSTDLAAFPVLIEALVNGGSDLAVGSRLHVNSQTRRGFKREFLSRGYKLLLTMMFQTRFSDAQCGFKAIKKQAAGGLLPLLKNDGWFMDTELLVLAERLGYRIRDVPVCWVEDKDSRVRIARTIIEDIYGLVHLRWSLGKRMRQWKEKSPSLE